MVDQGIIMMKKALFLDIDGVLNTNHLRATRKCLFHHCFQSGLPLTKDRLDLDQQLIDNLFNVIDENTDIVISSMWRLGSKPEWFSELFALYNKIINPERIKFIRCDALEEFDGQRQDFIEQYLEDYPYDKYVAVDDTESHYHPNCEYVVFTNANIGITEQDAVQLLIKLNRN